MAGNSDLEINHTGRITGGNLIPETGGAIIPTTGSFSALIEYQNPERSIAVQSSGAAVTEATIWAYGTRTLTESTDYINTKTKEVLTPL